MSSELDRMLELWKEGTLPSAERLDEMRLAARAIQRDEVMSVDWWKSVLTIPKSAFLSKVA